MVNVKLKIANNKKLFEGIKNIRDMRITAGWINNAENAKKAYINEYGAKLKNGAVIPARPMLKNTIDAYSGEWREEVKRLAKALIRSEITAQGLGFQFGALAAKYIQKSIVEGEYVENAPSTIRKKGHNAPLRDTGDMLRSVSSDVKIKNG
jgi:hypothetical protein